MRPSALPSSYRKSLRLSPVVICGATRLSQLPALYWISASSSAALRPAAQLTLFTTEKEVRSLFAGFGLGTGAYQENP